MNIFLQTLLERKNELITATLEHLLISLAALLCSVAVAVPLAVWFSGRRKQAEAVLQLTNILQTIPSLAMLGLLIPFVGIGAPPALIALTLYALLPVFQNTYLGFSEIDPAIKEAATAFGLSRWQKLVRVELPLAFPAMISGIRTAAVLIIGAATLAALVGAGGLGNIILLGIDRNNMALTFIGAAASALLAVGVSGLVYRLQRKKAGRALGMAVFLVALSAGVQWWNSGGGDRQVVVAGKLGSEPDILINMYKMLIENENPNIQVVLKPNFGKTGFLFNALKHNEIDIYPEFTGTVLESLVEQPAGNKERISSPQQTYRLAKDLLAEQYKMLLLEPMGYQNTYALALPQAYAQKHNLAAISDLAKVKNHVRAGFTLEFIDRQDGYKGLAETHHIRLKHVSGIEPALRYSALSDGRVDLIDVYSTDAEIRRHRLQLLKDDLQLFPHYQGAPLMRAEFARRHPQVVRSLERLAGKISEEEMSEMNNRVKNNGETPAKVAADYLTTHKLLRKEAP
ncbi:MULTISPECIES: ABC transporter permease/substrate-binding protein [unclassified Neisseria]|uniref:ABC transporter permease/substrate-binding protein n=1 Tax=unclassified Neisseria TaxID=2623750 RepID=UPI001071F5F9|nr:MULTISPECIES: ABC transporter permease/substrate-binding protein [unclassified Neisseria]MBF0804486.1 ABC transporter permease/substrate-binding protein [Neisseria sp. 19428wB4_WF04]TFU40502.1 ABC transporter permease/substrate-binding protein [Neisseria sp. WF04]